MLGNRVSNRLGRYIDGMLAHALKKGGAKGREGGGGSKYNLKTI